MQLPLELRHVWEEAVRGVPGVAAAAVALSAAYRAGRPPALDTEAACAAYAAVRWPATYAAARRALAEVPFEVRSVLDLGAGAGAASWAAWETFAPAELTLVERGGRLLDWSRRLGRAEWQRVAADVSRLEAVPAADLVVLSYSLGEMADPLAVFARAWQAARHGVVLIEPGTKAGFALVHRVREAYGEFVHAPCPQAGACPMAAAGDWCHFAARVERTALHRQLKAATLGHEDEKFSYLVLAKAPVSTARPARIVRHPQIAPGRIQLTLCAEGRLVARGVSKRDKEAWRAARRAAWGETFPAFNVADTNLTGT